MKHILATTALVALTAMPAFAQTETVEPGAAEAQTEFQAETFGTIDLNGTPVTAEELIGQSVYVSSAGGGVVPDTIDAPADDWESAGSIDDIIFTADGQIESVVLDVGGFFGIGSRPVSASLEELTLVAETDSDGDFFVVFSGSVEELENRPELDRDAVSQQGSTFMTGDNTAVGTEAETDGALVDDTAGGAPLADEPAMGDDVATTDAPMADDPLAADDTAATDAPMADDPLAADDTAATDAPMADDPLVADDTAATDAPMADDPLAADDTAATDAPMTDDPMVGDDMAAGDDAFLTGDERTALTADDLQGTDVHDSAGERVGSISDIVLTEEGQVANVIIDVGGFLGIGAKSVAVDFADIQLSRDDSGMTTNLRATTTITADQFGAMEEWDG